MATAGNPTEMYDSNSRMIENLELPTDADTQIDIFPAKRVVLVPAADSPIDLPRHQQSGSHEYLDGASRVGIGISAPVAPIRRAKQPCPAQPGQPMQERRHGRPGARRTLNPTGGIAQTRTDQTSAGIGPGEGDQPGKCLTRDDGVIVQKKEVLSSGLLGSLVRAAGEPNIVGIAD